MREPPHSLKFSLPSSMGRGCAGGSQWVLAAHWSRKNSSFPGAANPQPNEVENCAGKDPKLPPASELLSWQYPASSASFLGKWALHSSHASPDLQGYFFSGTAVPLPFYAPLSSYPFHPRPSSCWKAQFATGNANSNLLQRWVMCYTGPFMFLLFPLTMENHPERCHKMRQNSLWDRQWNKIKNRKKYRCVQRTTEKEGEREEK